DHVPRGRHAGDRLVTRAVAEAGVQVADQGVGGQAAARRGGRPGRGRGGGRCCRGGRRRVVAGRAGQRPVGQVVGRLAVPAVHVDRDAGGGRAGGERRGQLLPGGAGRPGLRVRAAGAGGAEVDVAALDPGGQRVLRVRLHADLLAALGEVLA